MTFPTDWAYRKSHTITHPTGGLTNYQVKIRVYRTTGTDSVDTVYVGDKCLADFGDIRFTNNAGTELDYWMEVNATTYADFWVEIDNISTSTNIYIYYGNSEATTTSNGDTTFLFFDDFTTLDTSKWDTTTYIGVGSVSISSGKLNIVKPSTSGNRPVVYSKNKISTANTIIETIFNITSTTEQVGISLRSNLTSDSSYRLYFLAQTTSVEDAYGDFTASGTYQKVTNFCSWTTGTNYRLKYILGSSSTVWDQNGTQTSYAAAYTAEAYLCLGFYYPNSSSTGTYNILYDFIFQRNYATTEPTHSTWGAEQDLSATSFTIRITPTTGTDPLSVTYNCIIPEGTLTNFVLNYGDGNVYTPPPIITNNASLTQSGSFGNTSYIVTYRNVIPAVDITTSTDNVILKLIRPTSGYYTISHASIVERSGTTADGITSPTQITFNNGNAGISISSAGDQYIYSDKINFTLDNTKDYLVIIDYSDVTNNSTPAFTGTSYMKLNAESWNQQNVSGYTTTSIRAIAALCYVTDINQSSFATTHIYNTPGTYTVWAEGYNEFATHVYYEIPYGVTINAKAVVASFSVDQTYNIITFTDASTGNVDEWFWTFGDGQSSYEESPTHTYWSPATYTVTLHASNQYQYDTYTTTVTVTQILTPPEVYFTPNNLNVINPALPYTVNFTNLSTPTFGCTYNWLIDGTTYTTENPSHSFATYGMYDVGLTVTNALGSATKTYNDAIRITRTGKTFYEVINYADTPATFHVEVFNEVATSADTVIQAHIFDESINFVQDEVPDEPGLDEWGMRHFYSSINEWGHRIISAVTDWGNRILYNGSTLDNSPVTLFKAQEFREDVVFEDSWQFGTT